MRLKKLFFSSLAINLVFVVGFAWFLHTRGGVSYVKQKAHRLFLTDTGERRQPSSSAKRTPYYFEFYAALYKHLAYSPHDVIFIGDSHISHCPWAELFHNANVKNRGIAGDSTEGVLKRIVSDHGFKAKKVFIMIGINDILYLHRENEAIYKDYIKIVREIKSRYDIISVYVLSVLPVSTQNKNSKSVNKQVYSLNKLLYDMEDINRDIYYIDLYKHFVSLDGFNLDEKYAYDGLHLNSAGYMRMKTLLETYI